MDVKELYEKIYGSFAFLTLAARNEHFEQFKAFADSLYKNNFEIVERMVPALPPLRPKQPSFTVITDGACSGNPGPGGWAYHITMHEEFKCYRYDERLYKGSGRRSDTTNNGMELEAVIQALGKILWMTMPVNPIVTVITDSKYVIGAMTLGWKLSKNMEFITALKARVAKCEAVIWQHISEVEDELSIRLHSVIDRAAKREAHGKVGFPEK